MKKTIGVFAHVDAGKTTFSDQLLYISGKSRNFGDVNKKTSNFDTNEIERARGITIFSSQAKFDFNNNTYYFIDTPGHIDFSPEAERAIMALDYAILLINGPAGVQSHSSTLFRLLSKYEIPTFIFINKIDMVGYDREKVLEDISDKLTNEYIFVDKSEKINDLAEKIAEYDDEFLEKFLEGNFIEQDIIKVFTEVIKNRKAVPIFEGVALDKNSVEKFFINFDKYTKTDYKAEEEFKAIVYKIKNEDTRLTFLKCLSGKLKIKDEIFFSVGEKINDIRIYNGEKYESVKEVCAGDVFAVTGLKTPICSNIINLKNDEITKNEFSLKSALETSVVINDGKDVNDVLKCFKILEDEDPSLYVSFNLENKEILIYVMGKIQLEVLKTEVKNRFNVDVDFKPPKVQYRESIGSNVIGYGHYEPMRHYAEVKFLLEPNKRGEGITYESRCDKERLDTHWHKLIGKHIFEKTHKGILTGSPITDINIVLLDGKDHLKHTEPGDFREATYRAIRQGLEKAENIILEPYYKIEVYVKSDYIGRVMSDIQRGGGEFEPPIQKDNLVYIKGYVPVEQFMEYTTEFLSYTKGDGSISLVFDSYRECDKEKSERIIAERKYNKGADKENPSSSIFAAKGTSFVAEWYECEKYMKTAD